MIILLTSIAPVGPSSAVNGLEGPRQGSQQRKSSTAVTTATNGAKAAVATKVGASADSSLDMVIMTHTCLRDLGHQVE
jgi:hypothetical protein